VNVELLARFDREMRIDPPADPGVSFERDAGIVRAHGVHSWISWWDFDATQTFASVAREVARFGERQRSFEWKVYGHDRPANLVAALQHFGFKPDEPETLMLGDLDALPAGAPWAAATRYEVRPVRDAAGLHDYVMVTAQGFEQDAAPLADEFAPRLFRAGSTVTAYVVYSDGVPVAGARLECPPARSFAGLWGGVVTPAYRGRGIYTALVAQRCAQARQLGYRYATVDARETSRPILERLGFVALTSIVGWNSAPP
jgi:GNAT superfamily N-acetyltransferase